ncbi:MAG TPA: DUF2306 domain-containing protein [Chromatiaceae bacterium]|jgi:hypothetical protein|nr:MAG: hypothetical protein N838_02185 [Thiohalocapsa sp. PB-PSB1]QQO53347.1 MAG: DUF2306 domain-containing protein [Thiohalocapsa sp. PB-PSB1]HBG95265.1 DUF2306 domain-containing protein [Chromatiaceae bacterium]HCS92427.1 DUF2306 domain-containing protein [Chromatiaceae bacterium]
MTSMQYAKWDARFDTVLRRLASTFAVLVWSSAICFSLYIVLLYILAYFTGDMTRWNHGASEFYVEGMPIATGGIGVHFLAGAVILLLGSIQLIEAVRNRWIGLHRLVGRIYLIASLLTAIGGILFILLHGTIGGPVMNIGFFLYGVLMAAAAVATYRHARAKRIAVHRAWALRLYLLAIGSWLYRMEYGFWFLFTGGLGSTPDLTGPFDQVMSFFFYLPNLIILEFVLRSSYRANSIGTKAMASLALLMATLLLLLMTLIFVVEVWGPAIWERDTH